MAIVITSEPANEPLTADDNAKLHMRVDVTEDDELINLYIKAARKYIEQAAKRTFITQTIRYSLDKWPDDNKIYLPRPPLQSVSSIVYLDEDGTSTTWSSSNYIVDSDSEPGRVALAASQTWPATTLYPVNAIRITYIAGYGDDATDVPETWRQAIRLLTGHWYENREAALLTGAVPKAIPFAVESLINVDPNFVFENR